MKVSNLPLLYSFRRCPYAMRARMALSYAGIDCALREVSLKDKPAALLALSSKATVPVLQLVDGRVLDESLDIMCWALVEKSDWQYDAAMQALVDCNDHAFKQHLDRYKYPQRFDDSDVDLAFQEACAWLIELDMRLRSTAFLCANTVSLADLALFPFVRQFAAVDAQRFALLPVPALQAWLADWLANDHFQGVMQKVPLWHDGGAVRRMLP